jgi:hypothetical protein
VNYLVGVFIAGLFACISAGNAYPLVDANSVALLLLAGWFIGLLVLRRAAKNRDGNDSEGSLPPKHCFAIAFAPWFVCALLVLNAKADSSTPTYRATEVQAMSTGKGGPSVRIVPWRRSDGTIWISVSQTCYDHLTLNQEITVAEKKGALALRWISKITECPK